MRLRFAPAVVVMICFLLAAQACRSTSPQPRTEPAAEVEFGGDVGGSKPVATLDTAVAHPYPELTPLTAVYKVTSSAQPRSEVVIRLPVISPPDPDSIPLAFSAPAPDGPWEPMQTEPGLVDGKVQATTTHFSWFTALLLPVKGLLAEARRVFDDATGGFVAESEQPGCGGEQEARQRFTVASTSGTTLKWCFGKEGNDVVLRVVNGRRYPLEASHPGLVVSEETKYTGFASLARFGSGEIAQLFPGEPVTFRLTGDAGKLQTEFGGSAYGLYQLQVGVETALAFLDRFGFARKGTATSYANTALQSAKCAGTMGNPSGGSIIGNCFGPREILEAFGAKAVFVAALMAVAPVIAFFETAFSGLGDVATRRDRYSIAISPVPRPTTTQTTRAADIFDGPLSCQKILAAIASFPAADRDKIGILAATFVRLDPSQARALQMVGVPRNSGSGDAYDYRWTTAGGLRFNGPLSDYTIPTKSPFVVKRAASGEFTCEAR